MTENDVVIKFILTSTTFRRCNKYYIKHYLYQRLINNVSNIIYIISYSYRITHLNLSLHVPSSFQKAITIETEDDNYIHIETLSK